MKNAKDNHVNYSPNEYQVNIFYDVRDKIYVAKVPELEGCHSHGKTPSQALKNVREATKLWLEAALEEGVAIPLPVGRRKYSGKFVLRTSSETHGKLAQEALRKGVSLNDLVLELIDKGMRNIS